MLEALVRRIAAHDRDRFASFIEALRTGGERFSRQRNQALNLLRGVPGPDEPLERLRVGLAGYVHYYEIDFPLWFLGVIGRASTSGELNAEFLGWPASTTNQGALINEVRSVLVGSPFEIAFEFAYDAELRNAISHNDYELQQKGEFLQVLDHRTGRQWSEDEAWDRILYAQYLHHAVILAAQVSIAGAAAGETQMADVGVLSFTWGDVHAGLPVVVIPQLWCFRDLDPMGSWIDSAQLVLDESGPICVSRLTANATTEGPKVAGSMTKLSGFEWAWVVRVPVSPNLTLGFPILETLEEETFEVVGTPDIHLLPLRLVDGRHENGGEA